MGWIYLPSVSIQNGSNIVTVNNTATDSIKPSDGLLIGSYDLVEIIEVSIGQLKLKKNWSSASQSNAEAAVVPTFGDFNAATAALRQATTITQGNFAELEKWWTQLGQVTFKAYNNTEHTVRTAKQMDQDVSALEAQANALIAEIAGAGYARSESDMMADRERNNQLYAASGAIHHGKHWESVPSEVAVNEGMNSLTTTPNSFRMGRRASDGKGESKTPFAIYNLAGITAHLQGLSASPIADTGQIYGMAMKLPPAPKGTEVYDSATGVLTNFETDVDPKYGDVAADTNEAVARAFEGMVKNGDFRLGNTYWSSADGRGTMHIQDGKCTLTDSTGLSFGGSAMWANVEGTAFVNGETYVIEIFVESLTNPADGWVRLGYYSDPNERKERLVVGSNRFEFTAGMTNSNQGVLIYAGNNGTMVFSSFYVRKKSTEVVTNPVDLVGFEVFLRPINASDPFVYPYGMQQSNLTTVDGIATVENTVRPITHFEVYPGSTSSRGRGWNLLDGSLSNTQKAKIFQNPKHNIYRMNDGTLVQWTISQRTIRGAGNGDWLNLNSESNLTLAFSNAMRLKPRGLKNSAIPLAAGAPNDYLANRHDAAKEQNTGLFKVNPVQGTDYAINGECYFYVIATVPRLNQGAYHPSLNPFGTKAHVKDVAGDQASSTWYATSVRKPKTTANCFEVGSYGGSTGYARDSTGYIGQLGVVARPDGKFYDAIYDSGLNGIIDHRPKYGAWDASSVEQAAAVREEVKNGTYRGRESQIRSKVFSGIPALKGQQPAYIHINFPKGTFDPAYKSGITTINESLEIGGYLIDAAGVIHEISRVYWPDGSGEEYVYLTRLKGKSTSDVDITGECHVVVYDKINVTVEGGFLQVDVLGNPANILQCSALQNGWLGTWIPVFTDGTSLSIPLTRKKTDPSDITVAYSSNLGGSWGSGVHTFDPVTNARSSGWSKDYIVLYPYAASAKQTENSSNFPVFNGESGLSSVFHTAHNAVTLGALLSESTMGIILKGNSNYVLGHAALQNLGVFDAAGRLNTASRLLPTHSGLTQNGSGADNDSPAGKFLFHQINESDQASLNIVANELIYSSTASNWGDDSKVKVLTDSTFTDLNGNKCKAVTHKLTKPYGFIQNKI